MSSSVQEEIMDLDLNQEPDSESSPDALFNELSPWLNELESAHERIEERIRHLESIVSRIRQRETVTVTAPALVQPTNEQRDSTAGVIHERSRERLVENGDSKTYLIAKALNMEKSSSVPGGYFDCNICLVKAENPILTCCGHLFCWGCFYQLPLIYLNIKECPVCDGEVTDSEVIPIYGNGDDVGSGKPRFEGCGVSLPPRPNAKRVESVRQKIINRAIPFHPVHETLEHIRRTIDSIGLQAFAQGEDYGLRNIITSNGGGDNGGGGQPQPPQHNHHHYQPTFRPLSLPPPHLAPFTPLYSGLVVDSSEIAPPFDDDAFDADVESYVDTTSVRRNRRRSLRIAEIGAPPAIRSAHQRNESNNNAAPQTISFNLDNAPHFLPPRELPPPVPSIETRSQTVNPTEVVTPALSASTPRRRTEDANNGPRTRSRRRLR